MRSGTLRTVLSIRISLFTFLRSQAAGPNVFFFFFNLAAISSAKIEIQYEKNKTKLMTDFKF